MRLHISASINEASLLKALAHPARLEIVNVLRQGEACVCHLEAALGYRQAYISQQLSILRRAGLVQERREGWNIYYNPTKPQIFELLDTASRLLGREPGAAVGAPAPLHDCPCPHCNAEKEHSAC
jgi:ArsR family transcriptional regulator